MPSLVSVVCEALRAEKAFSEPCEIYTVDCRRERCHMTAVEKRGVCIELRQSFGAAFEVKDVSKKYWRMWANSRVLLHTWVVSEFLFAWAQVMICLDNSDYSR